MTDACARLKSGTPSARAKGTVHPRDRAPSRGGHRALSDAHHAPTGLDRVFDLDLVAIVLPIVESVLLAVVLDDHHPPPVHLVEAPDPPALAVIDVDVELWLRKPGPLKEEAKQRLPSRLGAVSHIDKRLTGGPRTRPVIRVDATAQLLDGDVGSAISGALDRSAHVRSRRVREAAYSAL